MSASYKGKKYIIISLLAILLDGLVSYLLPSYFNKINYIYPMFTISLIPFLSSGNKEDMIFIIILGLVYNLLYSHIFLYHALVFALLSKFSSKFKKIFRESLISYILLVIIIIILYDSLYFILIILTRYQDVSINDLIYKIKNSLPVNIMSVFVYYFIVKKVKITHKM